MLCISSVQSLSHVWLFATPWTAACQASLCITSYQSLLKLMFVELVMPSNHLILCRLLLLSPSILPRIRVFSNVSSSHQVARVLEFQLNGSPCFIKLGHQQFLSVIWKKESNDLLRKGYWNAVNITYDELSHSISCSMGGLRGHWKAHWWGKCQHPWKAL